MASPFISVCPHCRARLKLKDAGLIGKTARCPSCQEKFTVKKAVTAKQQPAATQATGKRSSPASASETRLKAKPKPTAPPDEELDPWLNEDLDDFATDDGAPSAPAAGAAPPPVQGVSRKRRRTSVDDGAKQRRRKSAGVNQVAWIGWVVGGSIAGLIGASAWGAIAAFTFSEWAILAWAIGGFVGFGVRVGAREDDVGLAPGLTALGIALASVILGKFLAVHFMLASIEKLIEGDADVSGQIEQAEMSDDEAVDLIISDFADEIMFEWEEQGREWSEPDYEAIPEDAPWEAYYDPAIWSEAQSKWDTLSAEEQTTMITQYQSGEFDFDAEFGELEGELFRGSFGLLDILFFFLAAVTSFKVGSGLEFGDD